MVTNKMLNSMENATFTAVHLLRIYIKMMLVTPKYHTLIKLLLHEMDIYALFATPSRL